MVPPRARSWGVTYQLEVTLTDIWPPIWRRLLVPGGTRLGKLHRILQRVMGWQDYHLHCFTIGGQVFGVPDPDDYEELLDESMVMLRQVALAAQTRLTYEYDFGDCWTHEILVEQILPSAGDVRHAVCLAGRRACPPEDVGGVSGYAEFLEAIRDPQHEEHDSMLEWAGGAFDPEAFDLEKVNAQLRVLR